MRISIEVTCFNFPVSCINEILESFNNNDTKSILFPQHASNIPGF